LAWLIDQGWLEPPYFVQMVFGILGGVGADLDNLLHMHTIADRLFGDSYEWSVLAAGRHQMNFATQAAMLGGNLRVGMEDSLYLGPGQLTPSNAHQVTKIRSIIESLGYQIATPGQPRPRLALRGADGLTFRRPARCHPRRRPHRPQLDRSVPRGGQDRHPLRPRSHRRDPGTRGCRGSLARPDHPRP